mgnify:CR=1 FL=1
MLSAKTFLQTEMTMNKEQLDTLKSNYCEMIIDGMDVDCLIQTCYDLLMDAYKDSTEEELKEEIVSLYDDEMLADLMG